MSVRTAVMMTAAAALPPGVILMAATSIEGLQAEIEALEEEGNAIVALADEQDRDLSDEDLAKIEEIAAKKADKIRRLEALNSLSAKVPSAGRKTLPEPRNANDPARPKVPATPRNGDPRAGFKSFGDFALCVRAAGGDAPDQGAQQRLQNALTTYGNEGTGADGGFLVPPDFRREIAQKVMGEGSLIDRTDRMVTSSNSIVLPKDETTPHGGTGIQAYWESEGGQKTQSKPVFGQNALRLNKLIALVPVTDELLDDAPAIDSYLRRRVPEVMTAKVNTAIVRGTGGGQPRGILNAPALITVNPNVSQPADSIWFENVAAMYSRMAASSLPRAVWLVNQSILPQLFTMAFDPQATAGKVPIYLPGGMVADAPFGTLLGRPILPLEATSALGDVGDIIFADLSQYLTVTKGQDVQTDVSMHLFFDYDVTAFRFVFRVAGQPWWESAITPEASGAATLSHFVTLAARA